MKHLVAVIAAMLIAFTARAQLGIMAGVTTSLNEVESSSLSVKDITQYHVGIAYKFLIGGCAIQPGIQYNIKGEVLEDGDYSAMFKTGFVEVPVQAQIGFRVSGFRPYIFAEPYLGFAFSNETTESTAEESVTNWDTVRDRLEFGLGFGAGIDLYKHLQLSAKYVFNSKPIYYNDTIQNYDITQQKSAGIMVTAAIFF